MKRDMDLVRKIVLAIEEQPHGHPDEFTLEGYSEEQVGYHLHLMLQAGLIDGSDVTCAGSLSPQAIVNSLTWAGHEFADASRNETIWNKAKQVVKEKVGSVGIGVLIEYLQKLARSALEM